MKEKNKKNWSIALLIILVIILVIITLKVVYNNIHKNKENEQNNELSIGEFESTIDMNDTTNSEIREDGMKVNTSNQISKGIQFNDLHIKNIQIESTGDMAIFNAVVENNLEKDIEGYIIYITFLKKDGTVIDRVETLFPDIPNGETGFITATTPKDIATAYDIKIERQVQ